MNSDGVLEFVLTTTDAEVVFVETDNNLVHGETIKVHRSSHSLGTCDRICPCSLFCGNW